MKRDKAYHYERAEAELILAQQATEPAVVKAHYQLAGYYLDRVYGDGDHSEPWIDALTDGPMDEEFRERADSIADRLRAAGVIIVEPSVDR